MTVGEMAILRVRIRAAAWKKFGNVAKFAAAAGVAPATAYAYLGGRNVTLDTLSRLASAAGVVVSERHASIAPASLGGLDREEAAPDDIGGGHKNVALRHPTTTEEGVKDAPLRRWRLLVVTRCSRPENLPEVCRSVRAAAKAAFCKIFHDVRLDASKVGQESLPVIAEAGADAVAWHVPTDRYCIRAINVAIGENAQPGDWIVVLDDDTVLTPTAAKIVKKCHEADAGLLVWGAEAPDNLAALREPRDLAGNCVGKVDFCNFAFSYETWKRCPFQVAAGGFADGTFVGDAIRTGAKVLYFKEAGGRYNALRGGRRG